MPKKQKSGLYRTKIKIGVDAQGKDINKWVSGRTMAELETAKQEARAYYIDGAPQRDVLFGAYAVEWFKVKRLPRIKAGTAEVYRTLMNTHISPLSATGRCAPSARTTSRRGLTVSRV